MNSQSIQGQENASSVVQGQNTAHNQTNISPSVKQKQSIQYNGQESSQDERIDSNIAFGGEKQATLIQFNFGGGGGNAGINNFSHTAYPTSGVHHVKYGVQSFVEPNHAIFAVGDAGDSLSSQPMSTRHRYHDQVMTYQGIQISDTEKEGHNINETEGEVSFSKRLNDNSDGERLGKSSFYGMRNLRINNTDQQLIKEQDEEVHSSAESSPDSPDMTLREDGQSPRDFIHHKNNHDEVQMHKAVYEKVRRLHPPLPILPKSVLVHDDSPRSGGEQAYIKLLKFRGKDYGRSKFEIEKEVNQIEFAEGTTLKSVFAPAPESTDERKTAFGEIVYQRHAALDFNTKNHMPGNKKDEVLEENLLDVRRILKNSQQPNQPQSPEKGGKKGLINLQGVEAFYKKKDASDKTLIFESRFESGNLASALKVNDNDYHLLLQNDVNTSGHTQWFFFRVCGTTAGSQVRFNMLNLSKPDSLFNEGMKILVYSEKHSELKDIGWHRAGSKIAYYHNGIKKDSQKKQNSKTLYTLTFTFDFLYDDDTIYFAYCYPYNYSDMLEDLTKISSDPIKSTFCTRRTLCMSLAGNKVEMLTVTSKNNLDNLPKRRGVFLTARVHPGESVGSWMMKGVIDYLTDENNEEAEALRQQFVFKIIPMLNPDGVINGNYRCSLAGCDLNRRWKAPSKVLHPCIYNTKQLLIQFAKERELMVFCDFHGHSRRKNIFMYGCHNEQSPEETRLYPYLMSKICPFFSFNYSRFGNQKSKEATARIAMFNDIKIPAIYTMESSFCGMDEGPYANYHFSTDNLMQTGRDFCRTLLVFCEIPIPQQLSLNLLKNVQGQLDFYKQQNELKETFLRDPEIEQMIAFMDKMKQAQVDKKEITTRRIRKGLLQVLRTCHDVGEGATSSSAGSDKAPSEDNLEPEEMQMVVPNPEEDPNSPPKKKKGKKDGTSSQIGPPQDTATSISPVRKKEIKRSSNAGKTKGLKGLKKENSKGNLNEEKKDEEEEPKPQQTPAEDLLANPEQDGDTVTHKKKRKRNVESRDVWTQTDRSDYMLIKYKQKQKLAMQMAKSQKLTKEEQQLYEQALMYHKQHQLGKTQEMSGSNPKQPQSPRATSQQQAFQGHKTLKDSMTLSQGNAQKGTNGNIFPYPDQSSQQATTIILSNNNFRHTNNTVLNQQKQDKQQVQSSDGGSTIQGSRNTVSSANSNSKNGRRQRGAQNIQLANQIPGQQLGVTGRSSHLIFQQNGQYFQLINNQPVLIKTQQLNEAQLKQLQQLIETQQQMSLQQQQLSGSNTLPSIQQYTPLQSQGGNRKTQMMISGNATQAIKISPSKKMTGPIQDTTTNPQGNNIPSFQFQGATLSASEMISSHSSQRIANPSFRGSAFSSQLESQQHAFNLIMAMQNNPNQMSQRTSQGQMSHITSHAKSVPIRKGDTNRGANVSAQGQNSQSKEIINNEVNVTPILENAYIQKKLIQQMQMQQQQQYDKIQNEYGMRQVMGTYFPQDSPSQKSFTLELTGSSPATTSNNIMVIDTANHNKIKRKQQIFSNDYLVESQGGISGEATIQRRGRKNVSQKNQLPVQTLLMNNTQGQYFNLRPSIQMHQHSIIAHQQQPQLGMLTGSPLKGVIHHNKDSETNLQSTSISPVKINIVNFHNQFNIHNNIIINNNNNTSQSGLGLNLKDGAGNSFIAGGAGKQQHSSFGTIQHSQQQQQNPLNMSVNGGLLAAQGSNIKGQTPIMQKVVLAATQNGGSSLSPSKKNR